ncbi:ABC transporter permease [Cohnella nanjingensis]|uniref:Sugar ABC transporter permease n=1 Tax=Cohnella nanjingensis TaxID=1387779 RepID=A0A7X0RSN3_9BACL|nr:ABC transporter permease subunit [Cohnella nanjingensis]MBB6672957.1 sugar ABC transporter permease [Cohnella nanjingensis]
MRSMLRDIARNRFLYAMAVPGILFLVVFSYIPLAGHVLAFKNFQISQGIWGSDWAGLNNFRFFFSGRDWMQVTFNTLYLNVLFIVFEMGFALLIAIFLNEIRLKWFKRTIQSVVFLPYFISWVVVGYMTFILFNNTDGLINHALQRNGVRAVDWYQTPWVWPIILTLVRIWKNAGYLSIILLAAIAGLSTDYYESARLDGASRLQQMRYITLPLLKPQIIILILLGIGRIFYGDFGMIYGIIGDNGILFPTTDVIDTYSYRALRQLGDFSMSSAIVLYQSVMGLIAVVTFNWIVRRIDQDSRLF